MDRTSAAQCALGKLARRLRHLQVSLLRMVNMRCSRARARSAVAALTLRQYQPAQIRRHGPPYAINRALIPGRLTFWSLACGDDAKASSTWLRENPLRNTSTY